MDDISYYEDNYDARSSFDVQLPIQLHSRPVSRMSGNLLDDAMETGAPEKTEEDRDHELVKQAHQLGLNIPKTPEQQLETADFVESNVSAVTITSSQPDTSVTHSRTSNSTRPTSYSSSERQTEQKIAASAISIPSTTASFLSAPQYLQSPTPRERSDSKFRKSLRRLSTLGRKRASGTPELFNSALNRFNSSAPSRARPQTSEGRCASSLPPVLPPISIPRRPVGGSLPSFSETRITTIGRATINTLRPLTPPSEERESELPDSPSVLAAKQRSLRCKRLQRLRIGHLDEQASFLAARRSALASIRAKHQPARQETHDTFQEKRAAALSRHAAANADLETRHLSAEMDLERTLTIQRKACETKVKYMETYCYGSRNRNLTSAPPSAADTAKAEYATANGMPPRRVTEQDYRKLVEQYHLRNGMDQLHAARINVLREQQSKQADRISRRQEQELEGLEADRDKELALIESETRKEMTPVRRDWENKKRRMVWRWNVKESIERKRLEAEKGEQYGQLPEVIWGAEEEDWELDMKSDVREKQREWDLEVKSMSELEAGPMSLNFTTRSPIFVTS